MIECALCGHLEEEHEESFSQPCLVEGCECELFDPAYTTEDDEGDPQ